MEFLKVKNLRKSFGKTSVLSDISFDVNEGEFISLVGPSGCGKTTTLRCIAGLESPNSGEISLNGKILNSENVFVRPEKRRFGMVFQSYAVWPHLDVFENVAFPLRTQKVAKKEIETRVSEILETVRLQGLERRYGHQLSGGQQQRVALARALVMSPKLLLLDEPLSNLDTLLREELRIEIDRIQRKFRITTILVTHDQKEALSLCDRIIILNQGQIEAQGTPRMLYGNPPSDFVSEFLVGGQKVLDTQGQTRVVLPRRWKISASGEKFQILSRAYLGNEFEYLAKTERLNQPIKFYSEMTLQPEETVFLNYVEIEK